MLKKELREAIDPILANEGNKDEFLKALNECIEAHTGNPLKHSKLLKFASELFGYDNEQQIGKLKIEIDPFFSHDYPFS